MGWYHRQHDTLILDIRLQPGANRDEIIGEYAGRLKIRLAALPVDATKSRRSRRSEPEITEFYGKYLPRTVTKGQPAQRHIMPR